MKRLCRAFLADRGGAVALIFALCAIALIEIAGAAVDVASIYRAQVALNRRADAASLAAVSSKSAGYNAAAAMSSDGEVVVGETSANSWFNAEQPSGYSVTSLSASVMKSGLSVNATVSYTANVPLTFLSLVGLPSVDLSGSASATNQLPAYIDFYLLLDNSPSMGVAATPADIATMVANTPDQCAFACHDLSNANSYYALAHKLGVTTRIDVLRQATQQLMVTADAAEIVPSQFRFEVSTFNINTQLISSLTDDLSKVKQDSSGIDLMSVPYQNWNNDQDTNLKTAIQGANSEITSPGSGSSPSNPQKVLFLVTDGVADYAKGSNRIIETIDPTICTGLKSRGVKIAILYTTYLPLPTNPYYNAHVAPWVGTISPKLQACATPGYFFEVSPSQGISDAMSALFLKIAQGARITS
ncbi:MAG: hypothetical protein JSS20_09635 [Proteobacteria bacterium]|nr:hypothetical protein [Pseudomonadota bacterium]